MTFDLEWREARGVPGRWRSFADVNGLKTFVAEADQAMHVLDGEWRIRRLDRDGGGWEVVTTAAAIARWRPPGRPEALLASRWIVEDAAAASQLRHVQRLRACLGAALEDGLIEAAQVVELVAIFEQAVTGEGPAGRHTAPIATQPEDIRKPPMLEG